MTVHKHKTLPVEYWYDRSCFSWVAIHIDDEGNQLGDSVYTGSKESTLSCIEEQVKNYKTDDELDAQLMARYFPDEVLPGK